jgi:HEAT repeat protein
MAGVESGPCFCFGDQALKVILTLCVTMLAGIPAVASATRSDTFYDHIKASWAFGEIGVIEPMTYRGGMLLAYPGRITELIHARYGRPRSILLIHEITNAEEPSPFSKGTPFVAPLRVLPRTKYWRDNLPNTPRHEVLGGRRYVFTGDEATAAKELGKQYAATLGMDMPDRKLQQGELVAGALSSPVKVLSEDSAGYLSGRTLTHINAKASAAMIAYAAGEAPEKLRVAIIDAIGRAQLKDVTPGLEKLAKRNDATGAAALRALAAFGVERATAELLAFSQSEASGIRAFAYGQLGARAGTDKAAAAAIAKVVASDDTPASIRIAAVEGLGRSEGDAAVALLRTAVWRGDFASRAAAMSLAQIGSESAVNVLKDAIREAPEEGMIGAVMAVPEVSKACSDCESFLLEQYQTHEDEGVRDQIAIVLQQEHDHDH